MAELEEGNPRTLVRLVCHGEPIATVYDLGSNRSFIVASTDRLRPTLLGDGVPPREGAQAWDHVEVAILENMAGADRVPPTRCTVKRHPVIIAADDLVDHVGAARLGTKAQFIPLDLATDERHGAIGVLAPLLSL